jgi:hypothetical protein
MPQTTLFYPLGDTAPAAKITLSSLLIAVPLFGIASLVFVALGAVFIVVKVLDYILPSEEESQRILSGQTNINPKS